MQQPKRYSLGTICRANKAKVKSLKLYEDMKKGMPYLLCPCSLQGQFVTIQNEISPGNYVVTLNNSKKLKLSVFNSEDLTPRNQI